MEGRRGDASVSFRRVLLEHRSITFQTKIDLLRQSAEVMTRIPDLKDISVRLESVNSNRNDLAHVNFDVMSWSNNPEEVDIRLGRWRKGVQKPVMLSPENQETWLKSAESLQAELRKIRLSFRVVSLR